MDADEEFYYKLRPMAREKDVGSVAERLEKLLSFFVLVSFQLNLKGHVPNPHPTFLYAKSYHSSQIET